MNFAQHFSLYLLLIFRIIRYSKIKIKFHELRCSNKLLLLGENNGGDMDEANFNRGSCVQ